MLAERLTGMVATLLSFGALFTSALFFLIGGGQNVLFIAALFFSLSLIPVSVTRSVHPELPRTGGYNFKTLFGKVPVGMLGCFASGMINSAFFSMAPVFATKIGLSVFHLSWFMSITVIGGFAVQWIVGIVSDRFDRTLILFMEAVLIALLAIVILIYNGTSYYRFLVEMAIFGGLIFAVYPVAVARANDVFEGRDAVAVSSALLLCYSIGAVFGPILASSLMALLKSPYGLYVYWSLVSGVFAAVTLYLKLRERITVVPVPEQVSFVPLKNTSSVAVVLDPRTDAGGEKEKS
jgi:MFS family permease